MSTAGRKALKEARRQRLEVTRRHLQTGTIIFGIGDILGDELQDTSAEGFREDFVKRLEKVEALKLQGLPKLAQAYRKKVADAGRDEGAVQRLYGYLTSTLLKRKEDAEAEEKALWKQKEELEKTIHQLEVENQTLSIGKIAIIVGAVAAILSPLVSSLFDALRLTAILRHLLGIGDP